MAHAVPEVAPEGVGTAESAGRAPTPDERWQDRLAWVAFLAVAVFALVGIGGPLIGSGVFAGTDELVSNGPYRDAGFAGSPIRNTYTDDTYDTIIPNTLLFADELRNGEIAAWNPYTLGGAPLGATPNFAVASPLTVPYYVLPGWIAPAYVKLLEIAVAVGATFLFCRRLGLPRVAALTGGLVFSSSAFLVAWTNWPQTRTAALIPLVFWALERLVQRRRVADAALLALPVAGMLLGGFPAVTGYALLIGGLYLLTRALAEHLDGRWWRTLRVLLVGGVGVAGGVALAAFQIVPFTSFLSESLVAGRAQTPGDHLPYQALLTALAPWALGTIDQSRPPAFALSTNMIESVSYVGAGALVLVAVAVVRVRSSRSLLPRATWSFLVVSTAVGIVVTFGGGWPLRALQELPVLFADNAVGRLRSVLGFLVAVLVAVGLSSLLTHARSRGGRWRLAAAIGSGVAFAVAFGVIWRGAREAVRAAGVDRSDAAARVAVLDHHVGVALVLVLVAGLCAAAMCWSGAQPERLRRLVLGGATTVLLILVAGQSLLFVRDFWPRSDRSTFYPVTDVQRFLAENLGDDRFAFTSPAMATGADIPARLRSVNGHTFLNRRFAEMLEGLPGEQYFDPPTYPVLGNDLATATSPVLDSMGVRYFVTPPDQTVYGTRRSAPAGGPPYTLVPDVPATGAVAASRPIRAVGVTPRVVLGVGDRVQVTLRDRAGRVVAYGERTGRGSKAGEPFLVPVPEGDQQAGLPTTASVTLVSARPWAVEGDGRAPALTIVLAENDGLRLTHAGSAVVYERRTALPRIRWASEAVVEPDPETRMGIVSRGLLRPSQVLLDEPSRPAVGQPASVRVIRDGVDGIEIDVRAGGAGYVVVADALQKGWSAQVDGESAPLVPADHGLVAVPVEPGTHVVELSYTAPDGRRGLWISLAAVMGLVAVTAVERTRRFRGGSTERRGGESTR